MWEQDRGGDEVEHTLSAPGLGWVETGAWMVCPACLLSSFILRWLCWGLNTPFMNMKAASALIPIKKNINLHRLHNSTMYKYLFFDSNKFVSSASSAASQIHLHSLADFAPNSKDKIVTIIVTARISNDDQRIHV